MDAGGLALVEPAWVIARDRAECCWCIAHAAARRLCGLLVGCHKSPFSAFWRCRSVQMRISNNDLYKRVNRRRQHHKRSSENDHLGVLLVAKVKVPTRPRTHVGQRYTSVKHSAYASSILRYCVTISKNWGTLPAAAIKITQVTAVRLGAPVTLRNPHALTQVAAHHRHDSWCLWKHKSSCVPH